jgi:AraC-like DNA-binding protein
MDKVVAYIDAHIDDETLSPEALADHLQISLRNLYRKFKELELPAPNDFIKNQRMAVAAKMLLTTADTVQEIMYRIGFTNRSHFYKEFGRRYGMTPGDYRAQNRKIDNSLSDKQ